MCFSQINSEHVNVIGMAFAHAPNSSQESAGRVAERV